MSSPTSLRLYSYFRSSTAYRARIALNFKGIRYDQIPVHLVRDGGENLKAAYRKLNPQMRVPALSFEQDGNTYTLVQSPAIIEWLDEVYPAPALLPPDPFARARTRALAAIIGCDIHPLDNVSSLNFLRQRMGQSKEAINAWYAHWIVEGFRAIEALLGEGPYALGDAVTIADVYIVPQVFNAHRFDIPLAEFPKIESVAEACASLAAFAEAHPERQPDAE